MTPAEKIFSEAHKLGVAPGRVVEITREVATPRAGLDHKGPERILVNIITMQFFAGVDTSVVIAELETLAAAHASPRYCITDDNTRRVVVRELEYLRAQVALDPARATDIITAHIQQLTR